MVNQIRDPKLVTLGSSKWVTFGKLARRQSLSAVDATDAHSLLVSAVPVSVFYYSYSSLEADGIEYPAVSFFSFGGRLYQTVS